MSRPVKKCARCGQRKALSAFSDLARSHDGKHSWCKVCKRKYARRYNQSPRVKQQTRGNNLRRLYGISVEDYEKLYEQQSGMCLLCGVPGKQMGLRDGLHVDHDHRTGKIRGLLCNTCNRTLGLFKDSLTIVRRAARYLEFHSG